MSRSIYSALFGFCLAIVSVSAVGCSEENAVIEDTRSETEIAAEEEAYEAEMEAADDVSR